MNNNLQSEDLWLLLGAALDKAASKGVFTIKEASNINFVYENLKLSHEQLSEQGKETNDKKTQRSPKKTVEKVQ